MTERQGVFPPEGTEDGTFHWLSRPPNISERVEWNAGCWWHGNQNSTPPDFMDLLGWTYLGPAPTYEQAQADAADARRFRWVASLDHGGTREIRLSGVKRNGDAWSHGISWNRTSDHADIRAAIDAEMGERP